MVDRDGMRCQIPPSGAESATCELTKGINDDLCSGRQFEFHELCNTSPTQGRH
jgi:hypothetical protein